MEHREKKKLGRMVLSALFIFVLLATPIVLGCGKKAPPKPPKLSSTSQSPEIG